MFRLLLFVLAGASMAWAQTAAPASDSPASSLKRQLSTYLGEYHPTIGEFERAAAEAQKAGVPQALILWHRFSHYLYHGEAAAIRTIMPQLQRAKDELLAQDLDPVSDKNYADVEQGAASLLQLFEKNPVRFRATADLLKKKGQAQQIIRDLRLIDLAIDQFAIETNAKPGAPVEQNAWLQRVPPISRLGRTGKDAFGMPYGPQVVDRSPTIPRAVYLRVADAVPEEYFHPFQVAR